MMKISRSRMSLKRVANILMNCIIISSILFIENSSASSMDTGLKDELQFIHREIGSLRDENRDQNNEIALLKGMVQSQEETIYRKVIEEIGREKIEETLAGALQRKRPARLLPLQLLFDRKNETDRPLPRRFYGPPTNCTELSLLGYTLNGYYLVKTVSNNTNHADTTNLETVYCAFKQPDGTFNPSGMEKRANSEFKPNGNSKVPMNGIHFHVQPLSGFTLSAMNVQFDSVLINTKNVFDKETGVFKVPKTGVYKFFFRGMVMSSDKTTSYTIHFHLYRNDKEIIGSTVVSTSGYATGVIEATSQLVRGERISLKTPHISYGQVILRAGGVSSFSGSLLEEVDK